FRSSSARLTVTSGLRRPTARNQCEKRRVNLAGMFVTAGAIEIGTHNSADDVSPLKNCGITPTIVKGIRLMRIVRPITFGSAANFLRQRLSEMTVIAGEFGVLSSSGRKVRPAAAGTSRRLK